VPPLIVVPTAVPPDTRYSRPPTLTVSSGAAVENLTLLGQYSLANFSATSDGAGGTLITDPPVSSSVMQTPLVVHH